MTRPTVEVADILRAQGDRFIQRHRHWLHFQQLKVLQAITRCRTAALGGHIDQCDACCPNGCKLDTISFNSCRDRHCPKCQAQARKRWIAAREREVLPTRYFHVVFTLPHDLNSLIRQNAAELYDLLFRTVAQTLMEMAANPRHLGAEIGFFAILHTWSQTLSHHCHLHCVIPAGGLSRDHSRWVSCPNPKFFLPVRALSEVFRGKFIAGLKEAFRQERLGCHGQIQHLATPEGFAQFIRKLRRHDWIVYAKPPFGGPEQVIRYLGRYTHRVAISNHRLISFDGDNVTFRWRDYAHGNQQRTMTLSAEEFIQRFVTHILPKGFVRIRHFGFMANYQRTALLDLSRKLLGMEPLASVATSALDSPSRLCPYCGAPIRIVRRLSPAEIRWKSVSPCFQDTS